MEMVASAGAPKGRWSVRGVARLVIAFIGAVALAVVAGFLWTAWELERTSTTLIRDMRSMEIASEVAVRLLSYQRLANLALLTREPEALEARDRMEREMWTLLPQAEEHAADRTESVLLDEVSRNMDAYLATRRALEQRGFELPGVLRRSRAELNEALASLEALRQTNETEVQRAYLRAQSLGTFFRMAAGGAAVVALGFLLALALGVRRWLLRPIFDVRGTIERLREGELGARAREEGPRELCEIAVAFNQMSERLAKQREEQLAFVAGVAHDLRNPLSALSIGVESLKPDDVPSERRQRTLALLGRQLEHLTRMLGDFLASTQIEAGKIELEVADFDLREAARAIVSLYGPASPAHHVAADLCDAPVVVRADRVRIEQVIGNLVSNAIKYSPGGGSVTVAVTSEGREGVVAVSDQGPGVPPEDIEDLFLPFRRRSVVKNSTPGAGLGLSIVRRIVNAHDGKILVESTPGIGSTFLVRLPLGKAPAAPVAPRDVS